MAKKFPPKNESMIGDPSRTEGAAPEIVGGGMGGSFKQPTENFQQMNERRGGNPNIKKGNESFKELLERQKNEQKPPEDTNPPVTPSPVGGALPKPETKNQSPSTRAIQEKINELDKEKTEPAVKKEPELKKEKKLEKDISHGI